MKFKNFNLLPELFFPWIFERNFKIGSYRVPTHRRSAHKKFFDDPFLFEIEIFVIRAQFCTFGDKKKLIQLVLPKYGLTFATKYSVVC